MSEAGIALHSEDFPRMGKVLGDLLNSANVQQLIVVDDSYVEKDVAVDVETLVSAIQIEPGKYSTYIPGLATLEDDELERISTVARTALKDDSLASHLWSIYQARDDVVAELDATTMTLLDRLLHAIPEESSITEQRLSGEDWEKQAESILAPASGKSLILVDRDFSKENKSPNHGLTVISRILNGNHPEAYCALLSHTVGPGQELDRWSNLAEEHGIPQHKFVVISKTRLADDSPDLAGFLHLMRLAILSSPLQELRDKVRDHFVEAIDSSRDDLSAWSVFDFDEAVFCSSRNEGLWEGETLLRVMSTFTNQAARNRVHGDPSVRNLINFARRASSVEIPPDELHPWINVGRKALEYQQSEHYLDAAYINGHYLPLESGDIFDRNDDEKKYILLAQPCDLMVRADGTRGHDSGLTKMVPLCVIKEKPSGCHGYSYKLPYWGDDGSHAYVHFAEVHMVRLSILDLCVFRADGLAVYDNKLTLPESINEAWKRYSGKLFKQLGKESEHAASLKSLFQHKDSNIPKELRALAINKTQPCCSNTGRFKSSESTNGFTANVRRVKRVAPLLSLDILRAFAQYQSRTAFDQPVVTEGVQRRISSTEVGSPSDDTSEGE